MSTDCDNIDTNNLAFEPKNSTTFVSTDVVEEAFYGSGSCKGIYGYDDMLLGLGYADVKIKN
jgi:hypothetical protein